MYVYIQLIFDKSVKRIQCEKLVFSRNDAGTIGELYENNKSTLTMTLCHIQNNNMKWSETEYGLKLLNLLQKIKKKILFKIFIYLFLKIRREEG